MMHKISTFFLALVAILAFAGAPICAAQVPVSAVGVLHVAVASAPVNISPLPKAPANAARVQVLFSIVFGIIGALSLLMVTIGGFRYITSEGDPQAAAKARGTIIYALVGLIVSITAVSIVTFVVTRAT